MLLRPTNVREGGKRIMQMFRDERFARKLLVELAKTRAGSPRGRELPGMTDEGWVPIRSVVDLGRCRELHAALADIRIISDDGVDNRNLRPIRCAQGHSYGIGVRPDLSPRARDLDYIAHGASEDDAQSISREGLSKSPRAHIHFYERARNGHVLHGNVHRPFSDMAIGIDSRKCMDGGIICYLSSGDVIISEWINGTVGPQYIRSVRRISVGLQNDAEILRGRARQVRQDHRVEEGQQ